MLDELRTILVREGITTAAIIDDVFDEIPVSRDVDDESWNFFLDDQSELEVTIIRERYGVNEPDSRWGELRNDDNFIKCLWENIPESEVFRALFRSFVDRQTSGRKQLEPLRVLLFDELHLQGGTYGSQQLLAAEDSQLLFIDLFLGAHQDEEARNKALARIKAIVDLRRESPPMIVLMSSSMRLQTMQEDFRDEAGLVGCQFRTVQKVDLTDFADLHELLYRLTSSYRDSLKLSEFLELWRQSLQDATTRFLKVARRLDLRDYADLKTLILNPEGELIGAYLLEVFGQYFQFELEEDGRLSSAALKLNEVQWNNYPAPHFLPAAISANIADGLLFRSSKILSTEPLQFGDVLFSTRIDALGEGAEPVADFAKGERIALLVLTAACDLQHGRAKRFLFLAGIARPSELIFHKKPSELLTPVLINDGKQYVLDWDLGAPIAWTGSELIKQIDSKTFQRVRRFRSLFSLQLQQRFTMSLSRVGTPVMPPMQHLVGATVSYADRNRDLRELIRFTPSDRKAVVLVGRTEDKFVDRLMFAPEVVSDLRVEMQKLDPANLGVGNREKWKSAVKNRELFCKMEEGIPYERKGLARSFKGSTYDVVTIIGPYLDDDKIPIDAERKLSGDSGPIIVELEMPDPISGFDEVSCTPEASQQS